MADDEQGSQKRDEQDRNDDLGSYLYVIGGIPVLILFFVILFLVTGACDQMNVMVPA